MSGTTKGFSLIETLVALVILSIGLLGVAVMQVEGLKAGNTALLRTNAVYLAADMADKIRANRAAASSYEVGPGPFGDPGVKCADDADGLAPNDCSAEDMAAYDIWIWKQTVEGPAGDNVRSVLPGGEGSIVRDTATLPNTFNITIRWEEQGQPLDYTLSMQL